MSLLIGNSGSSSASSSAGQCPELATPSTIITKENVDALRLDNYNRTTGNTVVVSCLAAPDYHLVGPNVLTCLSSGQWDKKTPYCRPRESTSAGGWEDDISMVPMLVAAASLGVMLMAFIGVMTYVLCCWRQSKSGSHAHRELKPPIGLFRSLSLQEAESIFNQRRHRYSAASDCSDVIDSVSARWPSQTLNRSPDTVARHPMSDTVSRSSPTTYITAISRGTEAPYRARPYSFALGDADRRPFSDTMSRSSPPTTYVTALSRRAEPPPPAFKIQVGTGQRYRTWHELFYNSFS